MGVAVCRKPDDPKVDVGGWGAVWSRSDIPRIVVTPDEIGPGQNFRWSRDNVRGIPIDEEWPLGSNVVVVGGRTPGVANQQLRRVESTMGPEPGRAKGVRLGPALDRSEWPRALRAATAPMTMTVLYDEGDIHVMDKAGEPLVVMEVVDAPSEAAALRFRDFLAAASMMARTSGRSGKRPNFEITPGRYADGRRAWILSDGTPAARLMFRRGIFQKKPPAEFDELCRVARLAIEEGYAEGLGDSILG